MIIGKHHKKSKKRQENFLNKLQDMIHLICDYFRDDPESLGTVKLNKICWFSDVDWFRTNRQSISGTSTYIKQPQGPVLPQIKTALADLAATNKVSASFIDLGDYRQWLYHTLSEYDRRVTSLSEEQEVLILNWCKKLKNIPAVKVSTMSHDYSWWTSLKTRETIRIGFGLLK